MAVVEDLDVGATRGAVAHPQLDLVRAADWFGHIFEPNVFGGIEAKCLHVISKLKKGVV